MIININYLLQSNKSQSFVLLWSCNRIDISFYIVLIVPVALRGVLWYIGINLADNVA